MTARHQLADVIVQVLDPDALDPVAQETALSVADAVLGMIKPLEWVNQPSICSRFEAGEYVIVDTTAKDFHCSCTVTGSFQNLTP